MEEAMFWCVKKNKFHIKKALPMKEESSRATTPANIYLFKVNYRNTRKRCEIFY